MAGEFKHGSVKEKIYNRFLESTLKTLRDSADSKTYGDIDQNGKYVVNETGKMLLKEMRQDCWNITDAVGDAFEFVETNKISKDELLMFKDQDGNYKAISIQNFTNAIAGITLSDNESSSNTPSTNPAYLRVYGDTYIGNQDKSSYIQLKNGILEINGIIKNSIIDDNNRTLADFINDITGIAKDANKKADDAVANTDKQFIVTLFTDKGNTLLNGEGQITITATVYKSGNDVTDHFSKSDFFWVRTSISPDDDRIWNQTHVGVGNVIVVDKSDTIRKSLFDCFVHTENYIK